MSRSCWDMLGYPECDAAAYTNGQACTCTPTDHDRLATLERVVVGLRARLKELERRLAIARATETKVGQS